MPFSAMRVVANSMAGPNNAQEQHASDLPGPVDAHLVRETSEAVSVELRTSADDNNLIDFDASVLSESIPLREPK